jgi:hypothetical protein
MAPAVENLTRNDVGNGSHTDGSCLALQGPDGGPTSWARLIDRNAFAGKGMLSFPLIPSSPDHELP